MTNTEICNLMLDRCGGESIESIDEASPNARTCKRWYDHARRQILDIFDWSFARRQEVLALSAFAPPDKWAFSYEFPPDCIAVRKVYTPGMWNYVGQCYETLIALPNTPYDIQLGDDGLTKCLLTNMQDAQIVYTCDQQATDLFSPTFITNLIYLMGHFCGFKVSGKTSVPDKMLQMFMQWAAPLMGNDANQSNVPTSPDSQITQARL